jgi:hypothetical protein
MDHDFASIEPKTVEAVLSAFFEFLKNPRI